MQISVRNQDGVKILDVAGSIKSDLDIESFSKAVNAEIDEQNPTILLNFENLHYINSSGLGRVILIEKKLAEKNGKLPPNCPWVEILV